MTKSGNALSGPRFLTSDVASKALELVQPSVLTMLQEFGERPFVHVVVLGPLGAPVCDAPIGSAPEGEEFEQRIAEIARSKAEIHLRTGRSSSIVRDRAPHLLLTGDTVHGASVDVEGLVVAVSGVQPHVDEGIAGLIAWTCWLLCKDAQENFRSSNPAEDFYVD